MKTITNIIHPLFGLFAFACFALAPQARAVCRDGCDISNGNTFLGDDALINNTTGHENTAIGNVALIGNTTGAANTAVGSETLEFNITGIENTAIGTVALKNNTTASFNTAIGSQALSSNTTGDDNTATGHTALASNTIGYQNTANGSLALISNTSGSDNTANGFQALFSNTTGDVNTAVGVNALFSNTIGAENTAIGNSALLSNIDGVANVAGGEGALFSNTNGRENAAYGAFALNDNTSGSHNTANGFQALFSNTSGSSNIAVGVNAGFNLTTGDRNIDIGNFGVAGEANTIRIGTEATQTNAYIAGIYSTPVAKGLVVKVDSTGHLGTVGSSGRFKEQIKPMGNASEAILGLKPVTFRYKKEIDPERTPEFGLVAEEVDKVNPDLVVRDANGKPYTVRYDAVNAMLLNEFLKEHRKVEQQRKDFEAALARQQKQIDLLTEGLQKVSAQLELSKFPPQTVANNQ